MGSGGEGWTGVVVRCGSAVLRSWSRCLVHVRPSGKDTSKVRAPRARVIVPEAHRRPL